MTKEVLRNVAVVMKKKSKRVRNREKAREAAELIITIADDKKIVINKTVAHKIGIFNHLYEEEAYKEERKIFLNCPNITMEVFRKIEEFYAADGTTQAQLVRNMSVDMIFQVLRATDFLQADRLYDAACLAIAELMKDKTVNQIRERFGLKNDFTVDEQVQLTRQNFWALTPEETQAFKASQNML